MSVSVCVWVCVCGWVGRCVWVRERERGRGEEMKLKQGYSETSL